jgi:hypothetical protein
MYVLNLKITNKQNKIVPGKITHKMLRGFFRGEETLGECRKYKVKVITWVVFILEGGCG